MNKSFSNIELTTIATLIIASIFSLIVVMSLIIEKKGNRILRNFILIILFGNFLYALTHLLGFTGLLIYVPFSLRIFTPFFYLLPPTIFFYVVFNLNESFKFKPKQLIHLLPFLISLIDNIDSFFLSREEVLRFTSQVYQNYRIYGNYTGILFPVKFNYVFRMGLYIIYFLFSWRHFIQYINNQKTQAERRIVNWLKYFLLVLGVFILSTAFSVFYNFKYLVKPSELVQLNISPFICVGLAVIVLCGFIFFNPILLYGIPRIQNIESESDIENAMPKIEIGSNLYLNDYGANLDILETNEIELDEEVVKELKLAKSIIKEIKHLQLYKDTNFSLATASVHFNIPAHHISFVLNNQLKKSFPDIISKMRVEHAIALIENSQNKKYTLEAIGNMSGFRSRTTFYVSFKKITGVSPLEYNNLTNSSNK